jgi:peptide/nickel transport system substrate-binding protein
MQVRFPRTTRLVGASAAAGLLVAACAPAEDPDGAAGEGDAGAQSDVGEPSGEPSPGGSITVALEAESTGWEPWDDTLSPPGMNVARSVYDTLAERDEEGEPQPFLAESIEPDEEFTEYVVTLREGVEFHDGEPLDAEAVVANLEQHMQGTATSAAMAPVEGFEAEDDLTVRITLDGPHVAFADVLTGQAGMVASPAAIEDDTVASEPVGTGPFVFENWQRDQQLTVTRNDDYWMEDRPYLDEITFRPVPDEDARLQSLFSGDVDAVQSLRQSIIAQARDRNDEYNLYEHVGNDSGATILNTAVPPFDDQRVREAWAYAINQDELIEVLGGTGISPPARGLFNPDSPWFDEEMDDIWPSEDLERAQAALDEYVDDPDRSDGEEPGTPVSFDFDTQPDPSLLETSSVYQAQVERIGMEMNIETVEQAVHITEAVEGDYEAKIWRIGEEGDPDWMLTYFAPGSPLNFTNFESEELLQALGAARQTPDFDERRELYHQAQQIFARELPFTLTGHTASVMATDASLFGFDDWELPDGGTGVGHPESVSRWHSVWLDQ